MKKIWMGMFVTVLVLATLGCGSTVQVYRQHTLVFDSMGNLVIPDQEVAEADAETEGRTTKVVRREAMPEVKSEDEFEALTGEIFEAMEEWLDGRGSEDRRVLVFFHGGLNPAKSSLRRVEEILERGIREDFFPIFVNWPSGLFSAAKDRLFFIRQGKRSPGRAAVTSPYVLTRDLAVGVLDTPGALIENVFDETTIKSERWQERRSEMEERAPEGNIELGEDLRRGRAKVGLFLARLQPTSLLKVVTTPVIAGYGSQAWKIMRRRIHLLYHQAGPESDPVLYEQTVAKRGSPEPGSREGEGDGNLSRFLVTLAELQDRVDFDLTLVGHSMGGILVNESLRAVPKLKVANIVYLASADSLVDTEHVLFGGFRDTGYLDLHPRARVFFLTLHERAEVDQRFTKLEAVSRGSLLVWIDSFLTDPATPFHRTAGRLENLLPAYERIPEIYRDNIFIKSFDYGDPEVPQKHGEFDEQDFWKESFWLPD